MYAFYAFLGTCDHTRVALDRSISSDNISHQNACLDPHRLRINVVDTIGAAIMLQPESLLWLFGKLLFSVPPMDILRQIFRGLWKTHNARP